MDAERVFQRCRERLDKDEDTVSTLLKKFREDSSENLIEAASKALEDFESRLASLEAQLGSPSGLGEYLGHATSESHLGMNFMNQRVFWAEAEEEQAVACDQDDEDKASNVEVVPNEVKNQYPILPHEK